MKEHQIPFSAPMVRALLDGTKTQTRRVVKPEGANHIMQFIGADDKPTGEWGWCSNPNYIAKHILCPYGRPGARLWVREAWRTVIESDDLPPRDLTAAHRLWYEADTPHQPGFGRYRHARFMCRWMSRITLKVIDVRVERLHAICGDDAIAEGIKIPYSEGSALLRVSGNIKPHEFNTKSPYEWTLDDYARFEYAELWEIINGAGSWATNPWVWVVEFKVVG